VTRVTRPVHQGEGRFCYPYAYTSDVSFAGRPASAGSAQPGLAPLSWTQAGPGYKGMDPSDPLTYVRPWNPQPGMIAVLNFDGAQLQGRTPTQLQRGPQQRRPRRLKVSP
jgi:hypothetical protein